MSIPYQTANPFSTDPLTSAYAWIGQLTIDFRAGTGRVEVVVNADGASALASKPAIQTLSFSLGGGTYDVPGSVLPPLNEVLMDNAQAFGAIRNYLYSKLIELEPFASGSPQEVE